MMVLLLLPCGRLVAVQAVHTLSCVHAHFVLVHDRVLGSPVTFRAFSSGTDQCFGRLFGLDPWSCAVDQECTQNQGEGDHDCNEDGTKGHVNSSS
jgi:hypothetical protein